MSHCTSIWKQTNNWFQNVVTTQLVLTKYQSIQSHVSGDRWRTLRIYTGLHNASEYWWRFKWLQCRGSNIQHWFLCSICYRSLTDCVAIIIYQRCTVLIFPNNCCSFRNVSDVTSNLLICSGNYWFIIQCNIWNILMLLLYYINVTYLHSILTYLLTYLLNKHHDLLHNDCIVDYDADYWI